MVNNDAKKSGSQRDLNLKTRSACLDQAENLVSAAERLLSDNPFPNIAYHLAVLALEEIGKGNLIASRYVVGESKDTGWIDKRLDDHVAKLTWAIWTPMIDRGPIDPKDFEEARRFAKETHDHRLASLYVSTNSDIETITPLLKTIDAESARFLVDLARSRLELEKAYDFPDMQEPNEDLQWFLETIEDDQGSQRLFSKSYIAKHEELKGDTRAWVRWAREKFARIEAKEQAHLRRELARTKPSSVEESKPKWTIKVRVYTTSHSIRPKVLTYWNRQMDWVKLRSTGKKNKNEMIMEITLHDVVTVENLYASGFSLAHLCMAALNIGSLGFFWFDMPRQTSRYYDSIVAHDAPNMSVIVEHRPKLDIDWGQGALTEKNLQHALECVAVFGPIRNEVGERVFGPYVHGLVLLSKNDIHLRCEDLAHQSFIQSLHNGMRHFGDWDNDEVSFDAALHSTFEEIIPSHENREQVFGVVKRDVAASETKLDDAANAKRLTDLYFNLVAHRLWTELMKK